MNDPWDVKSVRKSSYYTSCMKLNGVPLLPPVLSKECRKEMQYYKLLAKEVEKRILLLKPFTSSSDSDPNEDKTDAPELPESEQNYEFPLEEITSFTNEKVLNTDNEKLINQSFPTSPKFSSVSSNNSEKNTSNLSPTTDTALNETSKLVIDLSFSLNQSVESTMHDNKAKVKDTILDIPEHDSETPKKSKEKHPSDTEVTKSVIKEERVDKPNIRIDTKEKTVDELLCYIYHDGPPSLSAKSFTGSLNDLHKDSVNNTQTNPLIRQRSYTVLTPSPLLLAHLQIQSLSTGVDMTSISMSESMSNLSSPNKKRRSWDLETAKAKWSNMALELNKKNISVNVSMSKNSDNKYTSSKKRVISNHDATKTPSTMPRSKSVGHRAMPGYGNSTLKPKSESIQRNRRNRSPTRNINDSLISQQKSVSKDVTTVPTLQKPQLISECEDPGRRVRELYERIQKQQLMQMATLVEKQKKEQMLLQQVFEEQNSLLYNQLKTICPKAPGEVKEAWIDKNESPERGPVSLSQLIDTKQTPLAVQDSLASCTLTDTKNYLNRCENILKKSRDITGSIKKLQQDSRSESDRPKASATANGEAGKARTRSPKGRNLNTSRKLTYETSASSDRDYELILTDRTNDTMADVNVTFPSDHSDNFRPDSPNSHVVSHLCGKEVISVHQTPVQTKEVPCRSSESAIRCVEDTIKNSILDVRARFYKKDMFCSPTAHERAAATKIVAYAKGYLVRRLMKTERVQSTVQTIRDALLCALQLHQDREGIRGADVDLHRRLIQQITAACYTLHDTFVGSTPTERCALLAADRSRRRALSLRPAHQPAAHQRHYRPTDIMSHSHTGSFPQRARRSSPGPGPAIAMTQSHHGAGGAAVGYMMMFVPSVGNDRTPPETRSGAKSFSGEKASVRARCVGSPRRRPWR